MGNDQVSSVRTVGAWMVRLYEHQYFDGTSTVLTSDSPDGGAWTVGNDRASSLRVVQVPPSIECEESDTCTGPGPGDETEDNDNSRFLASGSYLSHVTPYSLNNCNERAAIDPVTVVFHRNASGSNVRWHIAVHTSWWNKPTPSQYFAAFGNCGKTYDERVSAYWPSDRFHIRWRKTASRFGTLNITSLATPHHEDFIWGVNPRWPPRPVWECIHAVDKGGVEQGTASGYVWGRSEFLEQMADGASHHPVTWEYWDNTRERRQCDGDSAGSDGWVAFVEIP